LVSKPSIQMGYFGINFTWLLGAKPFTALIGAARQKAQGPYFPKAAQNLVRHARERASDGLGAGGAAG
jgi:hypothetical protein